MDLSATEQLRGFLTGGRTARDLPLKRAELRGIGLSGLRADGLDLEEADLRESSLTGVKWKGCTLRDARLDAADLTGAILRLCDLDDARLTGATLAQARLENSTARGARFDGADLTGAVLTDTDFSRASLRNTNMEGISASGADLTGADLLGADLHGADLRGVVGIDPAFQKEGSQWGGLPPEMRDLAEAMTPIVLEALRTAGERGFIDPETAERLIEETARHQGTSPRNAPSPDTLEAVSRVVEELGDNVLPTLIGALRQPDGSEPPNEVKALILRLREELGLDETAGAEDVLSRLAGGTGRSPSR